MEARGEGTVNFWSRNWTGITMVRMLTGALVARNIEMTPPSGYKAFARVEGAGGMESVTRQ